MTIVGFGLALLCSTPAPVHADLEDLLLEKGSLTKEEWLKLKAEKEQSEALQQQGLVATTGELIAGTGFERFRFKDVFISPIGFLEAASLYRSANQNADIGS
ncbi:MAG: hypothetical protein KGJ14_12355, partial [Nitrospirota bacterium]|nr:hypothetical protein [Nitrospirota bacterium]